MTKMQKTLRLLVGHPWSTGELGRLRVLAGTRTVAEIALLLERSPESVRQAAKRHRISLRRPGSRAGLALGQPRGCSWKALKAEGARVAVMAALREEILAGRVDVARLEQIARRRQLVAQGAPLCPGCLRNPQENRRTGLCQPCHHKELAAAHREDRAERAAQREYSREKQRAHRRIKAGAEQEELAP